MAKAGLAHDQTVEEILASIRRVISGDQAQRGEARVAAVNGSANGVVVANDGQANPAGGSAMPYGAIVHADHADEDVQPVRRATIVTAIAGGKGGGPTPVQDVEIVDVEEAAMAESDETEIHNGIELAIEQALDSVNPDDIRAETAGPEDAQEPEPVVEPQPTASVIAMPPPRGEPREQERAFAPVAVGQTPGMNGYAHLTATATLHGPQSGEPKRTATAEPAEPVARPFAGSGLLSPQANAAVSASFESLAQEIAAKGMRDLDQTVETLLRPMLRDWLDANLPSMVERMVREEIERVSRGKR